MIKYAPNVKDLASRNVVSRAITVEINKGRGTGSLRFSLKRGDVNKDNLVDRKPYLIFK